MRKYTVILLYPDYIADVYGQETYMTGVEAQNVDQAIFNARTMAIDDNGSESTEDASDWFVIAVIEGDHQDIKSHPEACV